MVKTLIPENKKQEILNYVHKISSNSKKDPFPLSEVDLKNHFKDSNYTEKDIKEFLEDLESNKLLYSSGLKVKIYYPKQKQKQILKKWGNYILPYSEASIIGLIYFVMMLTTYFFRREDFNASLMYPLILFLGYAVFHHSFNYMASKSNYIRNFNLKPFLIISTSSVVAIIFGYIAAKVMGDDFTVGILLTALGLGIMIGIFIYNVFFKDNKK